MDGFNSNTNNSLTSSNDKQLSSFILQSSLNTDDQPQSQLKPPLLISKIYEEQFFDHVNSDKQKFFFFLIFVFSFI